jgi:hypothetical protein
MNCKLQHIVRKVVCLLLGHKPVLNGQQYENVIVYSLDGRQRQERRLVEREWCGRCRKLLSVDFLKE